MTLLLEIVGVLILEGGKMKNKVSSKNIIGIREFVREYYGLEYPRDFRLTHQNMQEFLLSYGIIVNEKGIKEISEEDLTSGNILLVREEEKRKTRKDSKKKTKVKAYLNPIRNTLDEILDEMSKPALQAIRREILRKQGYRYDKNGEVEEITYGFYATLKPEEMTVTEKTSRVYKIPGHSYHKGRK